MLIVNEVLCIKNSLQSCFSFVSHSLTCILRHLENHDIWLPDLLDGKEHPENEDVIQLLESDEVLKDIFVSKPAVVQVTFISSKII